MKKPNPELIDDDIPELDEAWFKRARPAAEVLPLELLAVLPKRTGRLKAETLKVFTGIRLDADILEAFKASGKGWQTRMNKALREWLKAHSST